MECWRSNGLFISSSVDSGSTDRFGTASSKTQIIPKSVLICSSGSNEFPLLLEGTGTFQMPGHAQSAQDN